MMWKLISPVPFQTFQKLDNIECSLKDETTRIVTRVITYDV